MSLESRNEESTFPYCELVDRILKRGNTRAAIFVLNNPDHYGRMMVNEGAISPTDLKELREIHEDEDLRSQFLDMISS